MKIAIPLHAASGRAGQRTAARAARA